VQKRVRDLFAITRIAAVFDIDDTEEDSIAALARHRKTGARGG
jgi:hypothetical protein